MPPPSVSVVIPAYNAARTIGRALGSVFAQGHPSLEVIVVDDASRDGTSEAVAALRRPDVRLFTLPANRGVCGATNHGIAAARGELIAFLDADDEWLAGKLDRQLAVLAAQPRASFVTSGCLFVDAAGSLQRPFGLEAPPGGPDQVWRALLAAPHVAKPCVIARRAALAAAGQFDPALPVGEDQDMWIRLALLGEVHFVPEFLVRAYDTPDSLTKRYARRTAELVLPMVARHVAAQRHRLSEREVRQIWGSRYTWVGRSLYLTGHVMAGSRYLAAAMIMGHHVPANLWYLVSAAPPARWLKQRVVRGSLRHA
ncbi:MAG: glycosyltransferase [Dongiaceae bacterium]